MLGRSCVLALVIAFTAATNEDLIQTRADQHVIWSKSQFDHSHPTNGFSILSHGQFSDNSLSVAKDPEGSGHDVLKVFYKKGSYSHKPDQKGAQFYSTPAGSHTSLTLSYDIYFSDNFPFVKGGKLPGLFGGADRSCNGGHHSEDCFSTRFMWRSHGDGEIYAYISTHQESNFCSRSDVHCNFNYGNSLGRGKWRFKTGQWQNIAQHIHLNTPGKHNGYAKVWHDGKLVYEIHNIAIRSKDSVKIEGMFFSTFFGGSSSDWAATHDCATYYRNFVLSTDSSRPGIVG